MNVEETALIEHLAQNPADETARAEFQRRCALNPALREEAALHLAAISALKQQEKQHIKAIFDSPDLQEFTKITVNRYQKRKKNRFLFIAAGFLLLIPGVALIWYLTAPPDQVIQTPQTPEQIPVVQKLPDTLSVPSATVPPQAVKTTPKQEKILFARHFEAYDPAFSARIMRGNQHKTHPFFEYYQAGNYAQALANEPSDSVSNLWLFYRANAWMAAQQPQKAIPLLYGINTTRNFMLAEQTRWYIGLAYLQTERRDSAIYYFLQISEQPDGAFKKAAAKQILSALK